MSTVVPTVRVYRKHIAGQPCPWGQKAVDLLDQHHIAFDDHLLTSIDQVDVFKAEHQVQTTPQIFVGDDRIGGYTDLAAYLGAALVDEPRQDAVSLAAYLPLVAIFGSTLLMSIAVTPSVSMQWFDHFMGFSLCVLAILKLMDLHGFVAGFRQYDLLSERLPQYAYVYPLLELFVGLGLIAGLIPLLVGVVAMLVGLVGALSVIKAVYLDRRQLNCACVGSNSRVPLGAVSLTENILMVLMGSLLMVRLLPFG
ncbi:MAG: glutaredoxin [Pseudomonadota bacterium]|nr:glutaredoxin [Pseudomonadota bacterium]